MPSNFELNLLHYYEHDSYSEFVFFDYNVCVFKMRNKFNSIV